MSLSERVVFLDRDGVLTEENGDYVTSPDALNLLPGAAEAVARLSAAGWSVFVFTNQAGVGRGYLTLEALDAIHARLTAQIEAAGGRFTAIYACPHHPEDGCDCRKPKAGLLLRAAADYALDLSRCTVIGDSPRDIAAGQSVGCRTTLVLTGHTRDYDASRFPLPLPDHVFPDITAAAAWLCAEPTA